MVNVEFTSNYSSFKSGDVVALENSKAKGYIAIGLAKFHSECDTKPEAGLEGKEGDGGPATEDKQKTKRNKK